MYLIQGVTYYEPWFKVASSRDGQYKEVTYESWFQVARSKDALNSGDVFILDNGLMLYMWIGKDSNKDERFRVCIISTITVKPSLSDLSKRRPKIGFQV